MNQLPTPAAVAALAAAALVLAGCAGSDSATASPAASAGAGASVVATTTIWGDITGQIVECAGAGEVTTLMPIGADPHDFSPSSKDVATIVAADLVIANGLGLEGGLVESLESAEADGATVFEIAPQLDPLPFGMEGEEHSHEEGEEHSHEEGAEHSDEEGEHAHGSEDPHVWHDVARAARAAGLIGAEITRATGNPDFAECGTLLQGELMTVHDEVAATLAKVPEDQRILVTDHDALGYLAAAYDYTVAGTVIPGGSTLAEPSSAELAQLTSAVQEAGVPAIFANTANPQALVEALASEVGDIEVVALYVDSLGGPGSGADSFQGMVRTNAQLISDALGG
jgi:zinc/manganese transport system substrate-binding protein